MHKNEKQNLNPFNSGTLFCIPGFLGRGADWNAILLQGTTSQRLSLFSNSPEERPPDFAFENLSAWINHRAKSLSSPRILIGYSLGGRIALHALLQSPSLWSGAVLISTHPGLTSLDERKQRIQADQNWAERFETDNWEKTLMDWNSQPVFQGGIHEPKRDESTYSRAALGSALRLCSLGVQEDLRSALKLLKIPVLWVVGEQDSKFRQLSNEIANLKNNNIQPLIVPHSGHRILFDQPLILRKEISKFIDRLKIFSSVNTGK